MTDYLRKSAGPFMPAVLPPPPPRASNDLWKALTAVCHVASLPHSFVSLFSIVSNRIKQSYRSRGKKNEPVRSRVGSYWSCYDMPLPCTYPLPPPPPARSFFYPLSLSCVFSSRRYSAYDRDATGSPPGISVSGKLIRIIHPCVIE